MAGKRIIVTQESPTGRNLKFKVPGIKDEVTRSQLVKQIEAGECPGYHVRNINGVPTPVSNPNGSSTDNLN